VSEKPPMVLGCVQPFPPIMSLKCWADWIAPQIQD
jgi:hypothetical protein